MQAPLRLLTALRGSAEPGLMMAVSVATATFVSTPLILPAVAERFDVDTGTAGLFSAAQLGAFVVGSWASGRIVEPSRRLFAIVVVVLAVANVVSAIGSIFLLLVATRAVAGLALGTLTWLVYSQVFGDADRVGDITVVGPITGVVAAPVFGVLLAIGDDRAVFGVLAAIALVPLVRIPHFAQTDQADNARNRPVPQALVLVAALGVVTLGGSAVFVFAGALGTEQYGMDPFFISIVFSANAAAGIPAARWRGKRPLAGAWLLVPAVSAVLLGFLDQPAVFWLLVTAWGFCFWMAIPGIYALLSTRSRFPAERAGDAQASMAAGRAFGPLIGGFLVSAGSFGALGITGGLIIAAGATAVVVVELLGADEQIAR